MTYKTAIIISPEVVSDSISFSKSNIIYPEQFGDRPASYYGLEVGHIRVDGNLSGMGVFLPTPKAGHVYEIVRDSKSSLVLIIRKEI